MRCCCWHKLIAPRHRNPEFLLLLELSRSWAKAWDFNHFASRPGPANYFMRFGWLYWSLYSGVTVNCLVLWWNCVYLQKGRITIMRHFVDILEFEHRLLNSHFTIKFMRAQNVGWGLDLTFQTMKWVDLINLIRLHDKTFL